MSPLIPLAALVALAALLWPRKSSAALVAPDSPLISVGGDLDTESKHATLDGLTRGERNHNPGNIAYNPANQWQGQIGSDGEYCIMDSDANGIRMIPHVLKSYQRRGINTIETMIHTYSATDQQAYIKNVANALGMGPQDEPDLDDLDTLVTMVTAIIKQENGRVNYTSELINAAVQL